MCVFYLNQLQIASCWPNSELQIAIFVAVAWAGLSLLVCTLGPAKATVVGAKEVAAQDWYNVNNTKPN